MASGREGAGRTGRFSLALLDTEDAPRGVLRFYERELGARGWYRHDTQGPSGFLPPGQRAAVEGLFCRSPQGPSLRIGAIPRPRTGTELRLQLDIDPEGTPCARPPGFRPQHRTRGPYATPLPMLAAPAGATMQSFGHGGGSGSHQAQATMQSDLDLSQIMNHFSRVLEEAGWRQDRTGETRPVAWSSWTCRNEAGEEVDGFFLAFQQGDHLYALQLDRDISPGSRERAEIESRERDRTLAQATAGDDAARVEIDAPVTGETTGALRELIQRIVAPADPNNPDYADPRLVVGKLPDTLPLELPLPPASRILGSLVMGRRTAIYLESETLPRQIVAFYRTHLSAPAWTFFGERRDLGGFMARWVSEAVGIQFCPAAEGPAISIDAQARPSGVSEVRIDVVTDLSQTPCRNPETPMGWEYRNAQPRLPVLVAPPDADFASGGGNGSGTHWESRGYLYTAMGLQEVDDFYGRQFEAAGWQERDRGADEVVAWSQWDIHDEGGEQVNALFLAVRRPGSNGYFLVARANHPTGTIHTPGIV